MEAGDAIGEMALIEDTRRSVTAQSLTESKLVPTNPRRFQFLVQQTPGFALQITWVMYDRLRQRDLAV